MSYDYLIVGAGSAGAALATAFLLRLPPAAVCRSLCSAVLEELLITAQ